MRSPKLFHDRTEAGRQLAEKLEPFRTQSPIVLGLPRGGVVVAYEVALALDAPLDVCFVRKVGAPLRPEVGLGAVAEDGATDLNLDLVEHYGLSERKLARLVAAKRVELEERRQRVRAYVAPLDVRGRNVIVVDDGIAMGGTVRAAMQTLRARGAARVIVATPVVRADAIDELAELADSVIYLRSDKPFHGVGAAYEDFTPVEEDEVVALLRHARNGWRRSETRGLVTRREIRVPLDLASTPDAALIGRLTLPSAPRGLVIFAHGEQIGRNDERVAAELLAEGFGTLMVDLLTVDEQRVDERTTHHRFDVRLIASRLLAVTTWVREQPELGSFPIGYFAARTAAAAALVAAASRPSVVRAIIAYGGRPDLAEAWLGDVEAPTMLIVGGADPDLLRLNRETLEFLVRCERQLHIISGATILLEEPEALEQVARTTARWFADHIAATAGRATA